ncbi:hypothetical protein [Simiduia agarivorans]|uniref:Uncharacterized protein n=1 Tax=Simiduia agarivorans (strain DSM 21679 / JCM 13881 / BCRC 17597 / SA1) TaxID=1117647 RepID=K4KLW6_SIMAS|nr:hypothetical protein [Simiduia agarivorans]AFU99200.1 hypothetical protein M5M_10095 [Simiduia agarivorans SA1 = DSM 21679]
MCLLNRLILILIFCAALPCAAHCESEPLLNDEMGRVALAQPCEAVLSIQVTTRKRWQLNIGLLNSYRADARLPHGMRVEKNDRVRQLIDVTPVLQIEKRF